MSNVRPLKPVSPKKLWLTQYETIDLTVADWLTQMRQKTKEIEQLLHVQSRRLYVLNYLYVMIFEYRFDSFPF